ncbi:MAG: hypothetical protein FJ278_01285, partial [Planctomycetes bacterium]|nr:hypothetical protein [Planctomycetota bacterium]
MTTIRRSLCLLVVLAGAALAVEPIVLVDFEEAAKATPLLKVRHPKAELSTEQASQGKASLKMAFEKYEPGKPEWPMVSIPLGQAGLPKDWSSARFWAFDVFTPLAEGCVLRSLVNNEDKREWYQGHPVPPGKWTTIYIDLRGVAASVDLKSLARMAFYMTRPPADTIIYLDNVRLLPPTTESPDAVKLSLVSPSFH